MVLRVYVLASVRPTEDPEKVRAAILRIFPTATVTPGEGKMSAVVPDLARLRELIRAHQIQDTARGAMLQGLSMDGTSAQFLLGKQAAAAGRAHFGPLRSPLGDIEVSIFGHDPHEVEKAIYHLAPDTTVPKELAEVPHSLRPASD